MNSKKGLAGARRTLVLGLALLPCVVARAQTPSEPPVPPEEARCCRDERPRQPTGNLDGRWRVLFQGGVTNLNVTDTPAETRVTGPGGGFQLSRWFRPDVAFDFRFHAVDVEAIDTVYSSAANVDLGFLVGARYHPPLPGGLRPHVGGSIGVFSQSRAAEAFGVDTTAMGSARLGGTLEGGVDLRIGSHFLFNVDGILTLRRERASRFDIALGLGFIFGSGRR